MKKQIMLTSIVGLLALSFISSAYSQNSAKLGLYEDQALICLVNTNEESKDFGQEVCKVVQYLDILSQKYVNKLHDEFGKNYDKDTFDIESLD